VEVTVRRYVLTGSQPFSAVLDGIFQRYQPARYRATVQQAGG
jgi:hypothetical protein